MRSPSHIPTIKLLIFIFLGIWLLAACIIFPLEIGESQIRNSIKAEWLQSLFLFFLKYFDAAGILLGAVCLYFFQIESYGLEIARRKAVITLCLASSVLGFSARTGFPLGPIYYTDRLALGGSIPIVLPFLWVIILLSSSAVGTTLFNGRLSCALATGFLVLVTDFNLEFIAWKMRAYWLWYPFPLTAQEFPPLQNFATWFLAGGALGYIFYPWKSKNTGKALLPFLTFNALFLLVHLVRIVRN